MRDRVLNATLLREQQECEGNLGKDPLQFHGAVSRKRRVGGAWGAKYSIGSAVRCAPRLTLRQKCERQGRGWAGL